MLLPMLLVVLSQVPEDLQLQKAQPFKGRMEEPKLVKQAEPVYPEDALRAGLAAPVMLECQVDEKGKVVDAKVLKGDEPLGEAARKAVLKWRYKPLKLDGVPTGFRLTVTVNFEPRGRLNVTDLLASLKSQHEAIRESAAGWLGQLRVSPTLDEADVKRAVDGLETLLQHETSERVRVAAAAALAQLASR